MIVDPDFPDHWKTRMVVDSLSGDEAAPVYLIRLWGHCQNRKTAIFDNFPAEALKAVCRYAGPAADLERAFVLAGFVARDAGGLHVVGWAEYNASLFANWANGKKGGRPPKNPSQTHGLSTENPRPAHREPIREEEIREEEKREENPPVVPQGDGLAGHAESKERCLPEGWKRIPRSERNRIKCLRNTPLMERIGGWFNRKPETLWTVAEGVALLDIKPSDEDVDLLESWYLCPDVGELDIRRRDLLTLLNNWSKDLDRANVWKADPLNSSPSRSSRGRPMTDKELSDQLGGRVDGRGW